MVFKFLKIVIFDFNQNQYPFINPSIHLSYSLNFMHKRIDYKKFKMSSDGKSSDPLFFRWMQRNANTDTPVIFDNSYRNLEDPL